MHAANTFACILLCRSYERQASIFDFYCLLWQSSSKEVLCIGSATHLTYFPPAGRYFKWTANLRAFGIKELSLSASLPATLCIAINNLIMSFPIDMPNIMPRRGGNTFVE